MTVNTEDNVACGLPGQRGIAGPLRRWGTAAIREVMQRFFLFELIQFAHRGNYLWGLGVVMDHKHFLRGKGGSYRGQVLWVFSARTGDIGGLSKKTSTRSGELVAVDEPAVIAKPRLGGIAVEDSGGNRSFSNLLYQ